MGSSQPSDWTQVSFIAGGFFTVWATREVLGVKIGDCILLNSSIWILDPICPDSCGKHNHFLICCFFNYLFSLFWDGPSPLRYRHVGISQITACWYTLPWHPLNISITKFNLFYSKSAPPLNLLINMVAFFLIGLQWKSMFDFSHYFSTTSNQSP